MYVYEFLWRGRGNGETAWHVILGETIAGSDGKPNHVERGPLTPTQAEAMGFPLATIIAEINTTVMAERDQVLAEKAAVEVERNQAITERDAAIRERDLLAVQSSR